jgi:uncharacterized protein YndB with AHSA1/START domain
MSLDVFLKSSQAVDCGPKTRPEGHMNADEIKSVSSSDGDSVMAEVHIAAPPTRVFKALTDKPELIGWFNNAKCPVHRWEIDARLGGHYSYFTSKELASTNNVPEFECHGEILEFDPPRLLVYTWIASWHADKSRRTIVRWELKREGVGTHVRVTHSGLSNEAVARKDYTGGWSTMIKMLKNFVESNQLADLWPPRGA